MTIVEYIGGAINHRYLMRKTKDELISLYFQYGAIVQHAPLLRSELQNMFKWQLAREIMRQIERLPKEGGDAS